MHLAAEGLKAFIDRRGHCLVCFALFQAFVEAMFDENTHQGFEMKFLLEPVRFELQFAPEQVD
jgi:hypothetical protein